MVDTKEMAFTKKPEPSQKTATNSSASPLGNTSQDVRSPTLASKDGASTTSKIKHTLRTDSEHGRPSARTRKQHDLLLRSQESEEKGSEQSKEDRLAKGKSEPEKKR